MDNHSTAAGLEGLSDQSARGTQKRQVLELLATGGLEALLKAPDNLERLTTCEALLDRSWVLRHHDPEEMKQLAQFAVLVADRLRVEEIGSEELLSLRCRAWTELGNAFRVNDELDEAEEALGRAAELYRLSGLRDDLLGARLYTVLASLYGARRHFKMALTGFDAAVGIYRKCGDGHLVGRTLITKGIFIGYEGDADEAVRLIRRGLVSIDERRDPGLVFSAHQTLARFLSDCGHFREAQITLWHLRRNWLDMGGRVNQLKVRWLEGQIEASQGKLGRAEEALQEVKQGFAEADLPYKAALAGLELGAVWLRLGRADEAEKVVLECTEVFFSRRIQRETMAAVLVARKATEMKLLTLEVLNSVIERLRREERER
ncbi:MAG: hypothetical protein ACLGI9_26555 [Thermoanaerobaculia bacterium]